MAKPTQQIVLRGKRVFLRTPTSPSFTESALPSLAEPVLEEAELTPSEAADLRRDPEVLVVASPMPLRLIEPVGNPEPTPAAVGNTWGIEAIGAHPGPARNNQ